MPLYELGLIVDPEVAPEEETKALERLETDMLIESIDRASPQPPDPDLGEWSLQDGQLIDRGQACTLVAFFNGQVGAELAVKLRTVSPFRPFARQKDQVARSDAVHIVGNRGRWLRKCNSQFRKARFGIVDTGVLGACTRRSTRCWCASRGDLASTRLTSLSSRR